MLLTLIATPALAYKIARTEEKRELLGIMTKDWFAEGEKSISPCASPSIGCVAVESRRALNSSESTVGMKITERDIEKFQRIWLEEFGEEIGADEARLQITRLDELYQVLYIEKRRPARDTEAEGSEAPL